MEPSSGDTLTSLHYWIITSGLPKSNKIEPRSYSIIPCTRYSGGCSDIVRTINSILRIDMWVSWLVYCCVWPMRSIFSNLPNPSGRTMALGSTQPLTEMSTRNHPGGKGRLARKADNLPCYLLYSASLKMEKICSSENYIKFYTESNPKN
jgi:hypothetical protein